MGPVPPTRWAVGDVGCERDRVCGDGAVVGTREPLALLWGTGVAGALSTWSTLARELGQNVRQRRWRTVVGYATATLLAGLAGIWLGGLLV